MREMPLLKNHKKISHEKNKTFPSLPSLSLFLSLSQSLHPCLYVSVSLSLTHKLQNCQTSKTFVNGSCCHQKNKNKIAYLVDQPCIRPRPLELLLHYQSCWCWEALLLFLHQSCSRWEALLLCLLHQLCLCLEVLHLLLRRYHHRNL